MRTISQIPDIFAKQHFTPYHRGQAPDSLSFPEMTPSLPANTKPHNHCFYAKLHWTHSICPPFHILQTLKHPQNTKTTNFRNTGIHFEAPFCTDTLFSTHPPCPDVFAPHSLFFFPAYFTSTAILAPFTPKVSSKFARKQVKSTLGHTTVIKLSRFLW